jgi:hypothetical protein
MTNVWYAVERRGAFNITQDANIVLFSKIHQFLLSFVLFPELAYFCFKFKRAIVCCEACFGISLEFGGHLASHCTRKYPKVASATYNLLELRARRMLKTANA